MNKLIVLLVMCSAVFLTDCKKGQDDPFLSLRTRKARVVGKWTMKSGTEKYTSTGTVAGGMTSDNTTYTETSYVSVHVGSSGASSSSYGSHMYTLEFEKDGDFVLTETEDGEITIVKGTWNFTGGIGDVKKKEQIILHAVTVTDSDGTYTMVGNTTDLTYNLKELRNKKLVITTQSEYSDPDGHRTTDNTEYVLEQ